MSAINLLLECSVSNDYDGCGIAPIELDAEKVKYLVGLVELVAALRKTLDSSLSEMVFFDSWAQFKPSFELADLGYDVLGNEFYSEKRVELPQFVVDKLPDDERTECDHLVVDDECVKWTCFPKHIDDVTVETGRTSLDALKAYAERLTTLDAQE